MRLPLLSLLVVTGPLAAYEPGYGATPNVPRFLGVEMSPPTPQVQEKEGLSPQQGVQVQGVFNGTSADKAGLSPGDVILSVNGAPITSMSDLRNEVSMCNVGDPVDLVVSRNGQQLVKNAEVQAWPPSIPFEPIDAASEQRFRDWQERRLSQAQDEARQIEKEMGDLRKQLKDRDEATDVKAQTPEEAAAAWLERESQLVSGLPGADPKKGWHLDFTCASDTGMAKDRPAPAPVEHAPVFPFRVLLSLTSPDADKDIL